MAGYGAGWIASFLSRLTAGRSPVDTAEVKISQAAIRKFEDFYGVKVKVLDGGNVEILPSDIPEYVRGFGGAAGGADADRGFGDYWLKSAYITPNEAYIVEIDRRARYTHYAFMDANSSIAALTLDTYADEAMSIGAMDESPVDIQISDSKLKDKILGTLRDNGILSRSKKPAFERGEIRDLGKFGDRFYKLNLYKKGGDIRAYKVRAPELVQIIFDPKNPNKTLEYGAGVNGRDRFYPWEFSHSCIPDNKFMPYGRSVMEAMRSPYQQLLINEALLAISRASKIDRLLIKIPVQQKNAMSAFAQLQQFRKVLKTAVFGDSGQAASRAKIDGFTDIALLPSGQDYSMDRMASPISVSDIEDVLYFRDNFLMTTRLPKGYLIADESTGKVEHGTLQAQDLKFSRALMPLQYGYAEGLARMIVNMIIILDGDPFKTKVKVSVKKPQAFSAQMIKDAGESILFIDEMLETYAKAIGAGPQTKRDREKIKDMFRTMSGLPDDIVDILDDCFEEVVQEIDPNAMGGQPGQQGLPFGGQDPAMGAQDQPPPVGGSQGDRPNPFQRKGKKAKDEGPRKSLYDKFNDRIEITGENILAQMCPDEGFLKKVMTDALEESKERGGILIKENDWQQRERNYISEAVNTSADRAQED